MSTAETRRALAALGLPETCLLVLLGISGSGKSTLATLFPPASVLSADKLREILTGDPGNQAVSRTAWAQLNAQLDSRLRHQLPTIIDAVNSEQWVRLSSISLARHRGVPAVALVVESDLPTALARNAKRPPSSRVPDQVVRAQHAELAQALPGLMEEGFAAVHHAGDLAVMSALVGAAARREEQYPALHVEQVFGRDLARVFTWHGEKDEEGFATGSFAVAGQELLLRWMDDGDPYDCSFQTPAAQPCLYCEGPTWLSVRSAKDLFGAITGNSAVDAVCVNCD
ncbi:AAA family ATPase [Kitasatospora sp. NPDC101801]|uniref:AAA family ATPase n=1 Tax=Kitasatospora sp. NPDC101801 TaxID=3364103 RepID=UPI003814F60E